MAKAKVVRKKPRRAKRVVRKSKSTAAAARKAPKRAAKRAAKRTAKRAAKRAPKRARRRARKRAGGAKPRAATSGLLTLTEVAKRTGISMPTLQRYKKEYQSRLASVGKGRTQRYKPESVKVFEEIKKENLKKRGRPRKSAAAKRVKRARPASATSSEGLISLSEIGRRTGISYPTLLRYVRLYGSQIPSQGTGRKRRFPPSAVPVFKKLRQQSRRGRRKGSGAKKAPAAAAGRGVATKLRRLERRQAKLEKQMRAMVKALKRPLVKGL